MCGVAFTVVQILSFLFLLGHASAATEINLLRSDVTSAARQTSLHKNDDEGTLLLQTTEVRSNQTTLNEPYVVKFQDNLGTSTTLAAFIVFAVVAGYSHFREITHSKSQADQPSDPLWDIMRFVFMWFYSMRTLKCPAIVYCQGIVMPGLFFIHGIGNQGRKGFLPTKLMMHVFVDNVLSSLIWLSIVMVFKGTLDLKTAINLYLADLWFLWALAGYHLLIYPVYKICKVTMGAFWGGAVYVISLAFSPSLIWNWLDLNYTPDDVVVSMLGYAMWYAMGLAINRGTTMGALRSKVTFMFATALIAVFVWSCICNPKMHGMDFVSIMSFDKSTAHTISFSSLHLCAWHALSKTALMLAVGAFIAPLSCTSKIFALGSILARMGKRAMIGYWALMLVCRLSPCLPQLTLIASVNSSLGLGFTLIIMVLVCSPASEMCFGWASSPWWLLDVLASQLTFESYRSFLKITNKNVITKNPTSKTPFGDRPRRSLSHQNYGAGGSGNPSQGTVSARSSSSSPPELTAPRFSRPYDGAGALTGMNMADRPWPTPVSRLPEPPMQGYPF